jgi:hypothetical protein
VTRRFATWRAPFSRARLAGAAAICAAAPICASAWYVGGGQQPPVFRGGIDLVNLGATAIDRKGNFVADLMADDFEIYEDGRLQQAGT